MTTTDLLESARRRHIRISEWSSCNLRIAHAMLGTEQRQRYFSDVSLRMGTHLEPMIVEWMADQGFTMYFTGDDQLELATQDPYAIGHPDGLMFLESKDRLSHWAQFNIPQEALNIMLAGAPMLFEAKTMNENQFQGFLRDGLDGAGLIANYKGQIQGYLHVLANSKDDEIWPTHVGSPDSCPAWIEGAEADLDEQGNVRTHWGSDTYREVLKAHSLTRPTACLVAVLCPGLREFSFTIVHEDPESFQTRADELETKVIQPLHRGVMPDPSHDGQAGECHFCPYSYDCPAVQSIMASRILDDIPTTVADPDMKLDGIAAEYFELNAQESAIKKKKKELRDKVIGIIGDSKISVVTSNYLLQQTAVKGRRTINTAAVAEIFGGRDKIPYNTGKPSTRLKVSPLYGPTAREDGEDD